jgi:hypothetical protein
MVALSIKDVESSVMILQEDFLGAQISIYSITVTSVFYAIYASGLRFRDLVINAWLYNFISDLRSFLNKSFRKNMETMYLWEGKINIISKKKKY